MNTFGIIASVWLSCIIISLIIYANEEDEDYDIDWIVIVLFPANLIFILKRFWKSIIKAIKS